MTTSRSSKCSRARSQLSRLRAKATTPEVAFKAGEKSGDPVKMYLCDVLTIPCNIAGLPGISIPCGFSSNGLPIGLQILGKAFDEGMVINAAHAYEREAGWYLKRPSI